MNVTTPEGDFAIVAVAIAVPATAQQPSQRLNCRADSATERQ